MDQIVPFCPACERDRGVYGVEMRPHQTTEPWRDGWRCPDCGLRMGSEGYGSLPVGPAEEPPGLRPYEGLAEVYAEETSRAGRWVPPDVGGSESTGRSKERVNPYARGVARRGA